MSRNPVVTLVIDGNPTSAECLAQILADKEPYFVYELVQLTSKTQALVVLKNRRFDLILLDLKLPNGEGPPVVEEICKAAGGTPVVVISDLDDRVMAVSAIQVMAEDYLSRMKLNDGQMAERIRNAVVRRHAAAEMQQVLGQPMIRAMEGTTKRCEESPNLPPYKDSVAVTHDETVTESAMVQAGGSD